MAKDAPMKAAENAENHIPPMNDDMQSELRQLRQDFANLSETVSGITKKQANRVSAGMHEAIDDIGGALSAKAGEIGRAGSRLATSTGEQVRGKASEVEAYVERNPWTAIFAAAGIGLVLGMMGRRS